MCIRDRFQADLDDVHVLFKEFVSANRPIVDIDQVSTGEYWFGQRALALQLTDRLSTSDAFLQSHAEHSDLVEVRYRAKRGWQEHLVGHRQWQSSCGPGRGALARCVGLHHASPQEKGDRNALARLAACRGAQRWTKRQ